MDLRGHALSVASVPLIAAKGNGKVDIASIGGYILVGIVVGIAARILVPGRSRIGIVGTLAVGVAGAVGGGWLAGTLLAETSGVDWVASALVAVVLVLLLRAASKRRIL